MSDVKQSPEIRQYPELRQEIIEAQKAQAEFLKWKLISVAVIASVSFGLEEKNSLGPSRILFLCLIPLLCAYVDLISYHIMTRTRIVGSFLKEKGDPYEKFVFKAREEADPFVFEKGALRGASVVFNAGVFLVGLVTLIRIECSINFGEWETWCPFFCMISGVLGVVWNFSISMSYAALGKKIAALAKRELSGKE